MHAHPAKAPLKAMSAYWRSGKRVVLFLSATRIVAALSLEHRKYWWNRSKCLPHRRGIILIQCQDCDWQICLRSRQRALRVMCCDWSSGRWLTNLSMSLDGNKFNLAVRQGYGVNSGNVKPASSYRKFSFWSTHASWSCYPSSRVQAWWYDKGGKWPLKQNDSS